jgi:hypothetical protein
MLSDHRIAEAQGLKTTLFALTLGQAEISSSATVWSSKIEMLASGLHLFYPEPSQKAKGVFRATSGGGFGFAIARHVESITRRQVTCKRASWFLGTRPTKGSCAESAKCDADELRGLLKSIEACWAQ